MTKSFPNFFFFNFLFFFFCQPKLYLNSPNHTFQQIFYLSRKGSHFSGEHTTTCWNQDRILPLHHTKLNYLWLSQIPSPGNEGKCQDQNLAGLAAYACLQAAQGGLQHAKGCKGQPASHAKACTAPSPWLCTFSHHCPDLILKGGEFNVIISLVWTKPKSQAGQRNPRGVSA